MVQDSAGNFLKQKEGKDKGVEEDKGEGEEKKKMRGER